jgi:hypothetical protein
MEIEGWNAEIQFHFPHDRFLLGWEIMRKDANYNFNTIKVYFLIITITVNYK